MAANFGQEPPNKRKEFGTKVLIVEQKKHFFVFIAYFWAMSQNLFIF